MGTPARQDPIYEAIIVPRAAVKLPAPMPIPEGFQPDDPATWPAVEGRLEYVGGRLLYMPPCGDLPSQVAADVAYVLTGWAHGHTDFSAGANEAGMLLGGDSRGADGAIWRRTDAGPPTGGWRRVPPVLAAEEAGRDEDERSLRDKARWYLERGVEVVWLVLPEPREVIVLTAEGERRYRRGERLAEHASLPGLTPAVDDFFHQIG